MSNLSLQSDDFFVEHFHCEQLVGLDTVAFFYEKHFAEGALSYHLCPDTTHGEI